MILKPARPIREFRFHLVFRYPDGGESEANLTPEQDAKMESLLQQFGEFLTPTDSVCEVFVKVGDREERHVTPQDNTPLPGLQTSADIGGTKPENSTAL